MTAAEYTASVIAKCDPKTQSAQIEKITEHAEKNAHHIERVLGFVESSDRDAVLVNLVHGAYAREADIETDIRWLAGKQPQSEAKPAESPPSE